MNSLDLSESNQPSRCYVKWGCNRHFHLCFEIITFTAHDSGGTHFRHLPE